MNYKININQINKIIIIFALLIFILGSFLMLKSRSFPRLSLWHILESEKIEDFYWHPTERIPGVFHFDYPDNNLELFHREITPVIASETGEMGKAMKIAAYIMALNKNFVDQGKIASWDSPSGLLNQLKHGFSENCFYKTIIFSTFLTSVGITSRLWALEGDDGLGSFGHTVAEIYLNKLSKWVMIDVVNELYFIGNDAQPTSVLEARKILLNNADIRAITNLELSVGKRDFKLFYRRLLKSIFLRTANDFVHKYDVQLRYGRLFRLAPLLDKLPSSVRRGLNYWMGRPDYLMHYLDRDNPVLLRKIIVAKSFFYLYLGAIAYLIGFSVFYLLYFLASPGKNQRGI